MKPISSEEIDSLESSIKIHKNNHYENLKFRIKSSDTLEDLKAVFLDYIDEFKIEKE